MSGIGGAGLGWRLDSSRKTNRSTWARTLDSAFSLFRAQNWYWTQSITTRRPYYKANRYVCWSSAWFQPTQETYDSHTLVLNSGGCTCGVEVA
jgi:hypothetical protein